MSEDVPTVCHQTSLISDLSIFNNIQHNNQSSNCQDFKSCVSIRRLLACLRYHESLKLKDNEDNQLMFAKFMNETYKFTFLLHDIYHFQKQHDHQLYDIMSYIMNNNLLTNCSIYSCEYTSRHYRVNDNNHDNDKDDDPYLTLYCHTIDSLHYYLLHLFQCGLRCVEAKEPEDAVDDEDECFDAEFGRICNIISATRSSSNRFDRVSDSNKYNICVADNSAISTLNDDNQPIAVGNDIDDTFLDNMYLKLSSNTTHNNSKLLSRLREIIESNNYDTDSLDIDMEIYKQEGIGNVSMELNKKSNNDNKIGLSPGCHWIINKMLQMFEDSKLTDGTFSSGIEWKYDEHRSSDPLFVTPKYDNLKEEILNYQHINVKQYKSEIVPKADLFYETKLVQSIQPSRPVFGKETMNRVRLICIVMYTDFTSLSTNFASTFRKKDTFEPIQAAKKRHRNYYWFSKTLQQTVAVYGRHRGIGLRGPFYCGMSMVLKMPQFAISLSSPTSTSCHVEVAMKFSGEEGIIIEFDNKKYPANGSRGLDVSWLSRYREEDERLFFGNTQIIEHNNKPLNILSIRIIGDQLNLQTQIQAITVLDNIISGNNEHVSSESKSGAVMTELFTHYCDSHSLNENKLKYHWYLYNTFKSFIQFKEVIKINVDYLAHFVKDKLLLRLLMRNIVKEENRCNLSVWFDVDNEQNLPNTLLFEVFNKVKEIEIDATGYPSHCYPFSLLSLQSMLQHTSISNVTISVSNETYPSLLSSPKYNLIKNQYATKQIELMLLNKK